jgi:tetratricopeptide (TPR) repeat protein
MRIHHLLPALALASLVVTLPALAQNAPAKKNSIGSKAEEAAAEEARKAREAREARAPTVKEEDKTAFETREKVEATNTTGKSDYENQRRKIEFQTQEKRNELIAYLDKILKQNPPEEEKPELLFQKAELFLEEGTFHFFRGMEQDDAIAEALNKGNDAKVLELGEVKDKSLEKSKKWGGDAIKIYEVIEKKYPKFERMPDVLYSMGQAYWDRQDYKSALKVYRRLIKEFPKAQYIPDAWLAFGEFYFQVGPDEEKDVKKALDAYEKAAANQESQVFGYATYKQGWCHYNLTRYDKATEKFKEVILYSQVNAAVLGRRIGLAKEARKDYVLAYAQYGTGQNAPAEFKTVADDPKDLKGMLERLADIYYGDGKDRDAIITYQTLMKMEPDNTKNPLFQAKIVKLASRIGEKRQVVGQARKLGEEYKRVRAVFAGIKDGEPRKEEVASDLRAADDVSDNTLRFLATTWHNEAKKTLDNSTFEYAYELYGDYLDLFSDRKEAYEIRFFYAELLYRLEKFEQAGEQYVKVFLQDKKGKWAEASAEEAVRAYDEVVKDFDRANKKGVAAAPAGGGIKEMPIPEVKKKLLAAAKNYVEAYPKGKIAVESEYKIARIFWEYLYFNESTPRFLAFIEKHSDHDRAEQAANLVLDTYALLEQYEELNKVARTFLANKDLTKNEEFKDLVKKIVEESSFKLIAKYEKEKAWEEAAKRYLAFADEFGKSALADKALANAAATFTRAGSLDRAIKVRIRLVNDYKDSPLVADQMYAIAASYEQIVAYKDAAAWLEKFVEKYSKDPANKDRAKDALFNASIYRHGTGDTKQAVADREQYLKSFPDAADAEDVSYSIATAWEESGNLKKAIESYDAFADKWRKKNPSRALNAEYKAFRLREKSKAGKTEIEKALRNLEIQGAVYKKSGKPLDEVGDPLALVAFRNADEILAKYKDIKIAKPDKPAEFKRTLEDKRKAKERVDAAYLEVVKLKSPEWAVASLFRSGEATADLVKSILAVPPPKGLSEEQSQLFKSKLEEQTLPLEEGAANFMTLCLDKSAEFAVFNEWTRKCLSYLEEFRPQTYPKNSLEQREKVIVNTRAPEQGLGIVAEIPKVGDKPKAMPGTEPPPPPTNLKGSLAPPGAPKETGTMDFNDGGGQ